MSITEMRVARIKELEREIEDKIAWITTQRNILEEQKAIVRNMDPDIMNALSASASEATEKRDKGEAVSIAESLERIQNTIRDMDDAVDNAEKELEELKKEKQQLEDYTKGI
ncbi:hypothetical protein SPI_02021 [Niveomyces insectorum RCEF 264]|uniref:Uncharacterized protein n=1 Tax=Niveomyces insectorum RCEF 264 TaxID=1081102 RepID=A0A167XPQ6_9HYPO|nr:hypothetical protein SPI_02021 [Niveomyces insectorum RCEF 264]